MDLPLSLAIAPALRVVASTGSTNADLASQGGEHFAVLVTDDQTAGRGRLGRTWVAPPGRTLAISVLLTRPPAEALGWLPLLAGVAMRSALAGLLPGREVRVKWPNDVLVDGLKVCGILAELAPAGVVIGAGLNLTMTRDELPVPTATSLTLEGAEPDALADRALAAYLGELRRRYDAFAAAGMDADASGLRDAVRAACGTLGREVRVELPGGAELLGTAVDVDAQGRLLVRPPGGAEVAVSAGDVTHVRTTDT